jgi:hypothetical protein
MGLLSKIFSHTPNYPALDRDSPEAVQLNEHRSEIEPIVKDVKEQVEVVLSDSGFYVLIGNPPGNFGFEWMQGSELKNFKTLVEGKRVNPIRMERIVDRLSDAYKQTKTAPRFMAEVGENSVVVTKSDTLAQALKKEVDELSA